MITDYQPGIVLFGNGISDFRGQSMQKSVIGLNNCKNR